MFKKKIENLAATLSHRTWLPYGLLFLITLLAAGLRFFKLGEWSFWIDEIYTINHATNHFSSPELILSHIPPARNWVPLSVIFTAQAINAWGLNEWSTRFVSALTGVLTIPFLYVPLRKIFNDRVALIAMLLLAVSTWHIFWSQNARFYTLLLLFYSLALFVFYSAIEQDRPLYFAAFYILFYLAMSERMIAVLLMPVIAVYLLLLWLLPFEKPAGFKVRNILILSAPVIAFLIYEIYLFAATGDFIFASDLELLAPPIDTPIRLLIVLAFSIGLPVMCLALFNGIYLFMKKERAGMFFLVASVVPPLLIALANPFVFTVERYAFMTLLFWMALAASGIHALFTITGKPGLVLAAGILFVFLADAAGGNLMYYQINHGDRLEWRNAVGYVQERKQDGDVVVSTRAPLASYYLGENVLEFQGLLPEDLEKIDTPIWFIMDFPGVWHGAEVSKAWMENHAELVRFSYLRVREENYMVIYFYDPAPDAAP
jgi:mannosyltransferase